MFKWSKKATIEVNAPLIKAWGFYTDTNNRPKWEDRLDSCNLEGEFQAGAKIKAKIKDKPSYFFIQITDVNLHKEYRTSIVVPFFTQDCLCTFQEITSNKTLITLHLNVTSFLAPFLKSYFNNNIQRTCLKSAQVFAEAEESLN